MIEIKGLNKVYRTDTVQTAALRGVDLQIQRGEFTAFMGPSGCGKSTLLNVLGLLDAPSSGEYRLLGREVSRLGEAGWSALRKQHVGFIFQNFNLIEELTVAENVELALLYHDVPAAQRKQRVAQTLDRVGIAHRAQHRPSQLSGGQQQRVAVGRAVIAKPSLILADEPTGNLDSAHGEEVMGMLRALNEEGTTVLMVTHTPSHADHARRVLQMMDGQIVADRRKSL
ncbi:MAG: ABC transporter ATP-binding protein [Rubrivivax sp.]|nr:ABC transporter ATP-binding protein [Rubrivivax sp.]